jgi:adenylate kinase
MLFISGVHGVGKSYFCDRVNVDLGVATFSASQLISERKHARFAGDKLIPDIDDNQSYLLAAVQDLNATSPNYLLDGHFCLLNGEGKVTRIPKETFTALMLDAIVLLTEKPDVIAKRRKQRDDIVHNVDAIKRFQDEDAAYAAEIAETLSVPIKVSARSDDLDSTLDFVRATLRRDNNGR